MALKNKFNITDSLELSLIEEKISKKKAIKQENINNYNIKINKKIKEPLYIN